MAGLRVKQLTAKPASRLSKAHAARYQGCTAQDGSAMYGSKVLRAYRKAAWSQEHLDLAKKLGVTPKALQAEISRARKRKAD